MVDAGLGVESESVAAVIHQRQKFVARLFLRAENSQHGAGHGAGMLLFHAAHHHAEMARFADYAHAHRIDDLSWMVCATCCVRRS